MSEELTQAGVIGLGLMGTSIVSALLMAGHRVIGVTNDPEQLRSGYEGAGARVKDLAKAGLLGENPDRVIERFHTTQNYEDLASCGIVVESIVEDLPAKRGVIREVEKFIADDAVIGSNTSAIPVTLLQEGAKHPERILGIHWAEPADTTRFLEIICGEQSEVRYAERAANLARRWGKEPTLVRRDIRGFIANRLMYAMFREAFYLVENGYASPADIDRSARNDMGYWLTLAGPFRFMDLTGLPAYLAVAKDLFPELSRDTRAPRLLEDVVAAGGKGIANGKGFYEYSPEQARRWEELFRRFSYEIDALARRYPEDAGD